MEKLGGVWRSEKEFGKVKMVLEVFEESKEEF